MERKSSLFRLTAILILFVVLSGCSPVGHPSGGSNGNSVNGGLSAQLNDWLYFVNYGDEYALYRIKTDGTGEEKISDDQTFYLNTDGTWLYFCSGSDDQKLYKMKPDGTEKTKLADVAVRNIVATDGWIYFIDVTDATKPETYRRLFKIRSDGTDRTLLSQHAAASCNVSGDWLFYIRQDNQTLYKVKNDGSAECQASDLTMTSCIVRDQDIFFVSADEEQHNLWRMKLDGTAPVKISDDPIAAFNLGCDWIYTVSQHGGSDLELLKMTFDGSKVTPVNADNAVLINIHDDWLVYLSLNLDDFSIVQTLIRTDGSIRKDYRLEQEPSIPKFDRYAIGEVINTDEFSITVISATATNLIENRETGFESQIFDDVTDGAYVFITMSVTNQGAQPLDFKQRIGLFDTDDQGYAVYWHPLADITEAKDKDDPGFYLARSEYLEGLTLQPGVTRVLQMFCDLMEPAYPLTVGLFDGTDSKPLAAIDVVPAEGLFVTGWAQAEMIMADQFPNREITLLNGVGARFEGEDEDYMYYLFSVSQAGSAKPAYYLVKRDTGEIYTGAYDPKQPDYAAVPVEPLP
ncbi:MAG: DUF5050 domain-containing protein [Clostridiales bacterium]|nr:DUF5050 domain-containing protein [Clostridiales bacterium]